MVPQAGSSPSMMASSAQSRDEVKNSYDGECLFDLIVSPLKCDPPFPKPPQIGSILCAPYTKIFASENKIIPKNIFFSFSAKV